MTGDAKPNVKTEVKAGNTNGENSSMSNNSINDNLWKHVITCAISAAFGIAGTWIAFMREVPNRAEVSSMIAKESPYVRDQQFIMTKIADTSRINEKTNDVLVQLKIELSRLSNTLDHLTKHGRVGDAPLDQ